MTLYAIGDIQGCDRAFGELLEKLPFSAGKDELWLVGDLVNKGPDSLRVLRRIMKLGDSARCVLGNHDLHLLAVAAGVRKLARGDTFDDVLKSRNAKKLIGWLREQPMMIRDKEYNRVLVHAGIPPNWSVKKAAEHAAFVEAELRSRSWKAALGSMYGNSPSIWPKGLNKQRSFRYTVNALTRMRYCDKQGRLIFGPSGPPGTQPKRYMPWFDVPRRKASNTHIVFGHWSALGIIQRKNLTALDSGCVWGGRLTAVSLKRRAKKKTSVKCRR